jgi:hypothetical protein
MASFSFSMRFRSSARSRSTCCGEGVLGWWVRQAGSAQTLTTCPRFHDDRLSHLVAWFLVRGELATCTICFRLFDLQFDILIPPQGSAFAGIPRRRNLDELRFGFQSLSHGSLDLGPGNSRAKCIMWNKDVNVWEQVRDAQTVLHPERDVRQFH